MKQSQDRKRAALQKWLRRLYVERLEDRWLLSGSNNVTLALTSPGGPTAVFGQPVTFVANVSPVDSTAGTPSGSVTFMDGTSVLQIAPVDLTTGNASLTVSTLAVGQHDISAVYGGDDTFAGATNDVTETINQDGSVTTLSAPTTGSLGTATTLVASVTTQSPGTGAATGSVNFFDGTQLLATAPLSAGKATTSVQLPVGTHSLTATYVGNTVVAGSTSAAVTDTVTARVSLFASYSSKAVVGQTITVSAGLSGTLLASTPRTGTLSLVEGTTTLASVDLSQVSSNSSGYYPLSVVGGLPAGDHSLKVAYSGDANYSSASLSLATITVATSAMTSTFLSGPTTVYAGQVVTYTASVSVPGTAIAVTSGTVTFYDGTNVLGTATLNGTSYASIQTSALTIGSHTLMATYGGTSTLSTSTSSALNVTAKGALVNLSASYNPKSVVGQTITVSTGMSGTLLPNTPRTGMLSLMEGTTTLVSVDITKATTNTAGMYALSVVGGLPVGNHTLSVAYSGDANYSSASLTLGSTFTVSATAATSTYLSGPTSVSAGQLVSYTASVSAPGTALSVTSGTITFYDGTTVLGTATLNGTTYATFQTSALTIGSHTLTASYGGTTILNPSTSSALNVTVKGAAVSLYAGYNSKVLVGQTVTVSVGMSGTLLANTPRTGTLSLNEGTTTLVSVDIAKTTPTSSGQFPLSVVGGLPVGSHTLTISYSGDANYASATMTLPAINVASSASTTTTLSGPTSVSAGQTVSYTAYVSAPGTSISVTSGTVTLYDGTTVVGTATLNGSPFATIQTNALTIGSHSLTASYGGTTTLNPSTSSPLNVTVKGAAVYVYASYSTKALVGQSITVSAGLSGTLLANTPRTGTLSLNEGTTTLASVDISQVTTNTSGYYPLTIAGGLPAGTHTLSISYSGDANYASATTTLSTITVASSAATSTYLSGPTSVSAGQLVSYTASVSAPGTSLSVTSGTVTFYDGTTVLGTATLNGTSYATFQTSALTIGSHTLTASYGGTTTLNPSTSSALNVTVKGAAVYVFASYNTKAIVGQSITVSAGLSGTLLANTPRTGTLSLNEGTTTLASVDISQVTANSSGYYPLTIAGGLPAGSHTLTVSYSGDANYASATTTLATITVASSATTSTYLSGPTTVYAGQTVSYTASVSAPGTSVSITSGTVTFYDGTTVLGTATLNGTPLATIQTGALSIGSHTLTATYGGTTTLNSSTSAALNVTVKGALVNLSAGYNSKAVVGQTITVTAGLGGTLLASTPRTGTLSLVEGTTTLASLDVTTATTTTSGMYTLSIVGGLAAGSHTLKVVYSGDANYSSASLTLGSPITVASSAATSTYLSGPTSVPVGQLVTYTASVSAPGTSLSVTSGTVTFYDGTNVLGTATLNGTPLATIQTSALSIGSHTLTATYGGTTTLNSSTSSALNVTVRGATVNLYASYMGKAVVGQTITVSAGMSGTLLANTPRTGTLSLVEGTTTLASLDLATTTSNSNGYYPLSVVGGLAAGNHSLKVLYSGDANYSSASLTLGTITVATSATSTLSLTSTNYSPVVAQNVTFKATVGSTYGASSATGTVDFKDGTTLLATVPVSAGAASYTASFLTTGSHSITASYSGDTVFTASSSLPISEYVNTAAFGTIAILGSLNSGAQTLSVAASSSMTSGNVTSSAQLSLQDTKSGATFALTTLSSIRVESDGIHASLYGTGTRNGVAGYSIFVSITQTSTGGYISVSIYGPSGFSYLAQGNLDAGGTLTLTQTAVSSSSPSNTVTPNDLAILAITSGKSGT